MAKKKNVVKIPHEMTHRQLSQHKRQQRRQRIIFISGISIIVAIIVIIISGWVISEYRPLHRTVLTVYDTEISMGDYIDMVKILGQSTDVDKLRQSASSIANTIVSNELLRIGAEQLGVVVTDEEVKAAIKNYNLPDNWAAEDLIRGQILPGKVKSDYIDPKVPVSDNQVDIKAMLVESENIVPEIRDQLISTDNFTALNEKYALNYTSKNVNQGDYGWHPASILKDLLGSDIPIDWAFSAQPGDISQALVDTDTYKKFGYWLLRVNEVQEEGTANVSALLLSSAFQAQELKTRMENGTENLTAIADTYSQYTPSKEGHGELGMVDASENISASFNDYVYNPDVRIGEWSDPIPDDNFYTQGGAWLVQLVDKEDSRALSDDDRNTLIDNAYNEWSNGLWTAASAAIINDMTDADQQWAIDRAIKELQKSGAK